MISSILTKFQRKIEGKMRFNNFTFCLASV
jgi:hypothetical protein